MRNSTFVCVNIITLVCVCVCVCLLVHTYYMCVCVCVQFMCVCVRFMCVWFLSVCVCECVCVCLLVHYILSVCMCSVHVCVCAHTCVCVSHSVWHRPTSKSTSVQAICTTHSHSHSWPWYELFMNMHGYTASLHWSFPWLNCQCIDCVVVPYHWVTSLFKCVWVDWTSPVKE